LNVSDHNFVGLFNFAPQFLSLQHDMYIIYVHQIFQLKSFIELRREIMEPNVIIRTIFVRYFQCLS